MIETSRHSRRHPSRTPRALDRLHSASDLARAELTVPRTALPRKWLAPSARRPSVDIAVWTDHVAYADRRSARPLHRLVGHYDGFATALARRHYRRGEPVEDLVQVSHEALVRALQRFDPSRRVPFLAFAAPTITGTLRRHIRDHGWALRVPRAVHEMARPHQDAVELLTQDLGRAPTLTEVADFMGVDVGHVERVEQARRARATTSIGGGADGGADHLVTEVGVELAENLLALRRGLAELDPDDVRLLAWYFFDEQSQTQIATRLGVSQMQVSRLLARAVQRLRPFLAANL